MRTPTGAPTLSCYAVGPVAAVRPTILLFDVDGTLLLTGGAGYRALVRAFDAVTGRPDALDGMRFGGLTDRLIVRRGLEAIGRAYDEAVYEALIQLYLGHLEEEVPRAPNYRVMPGAPEVLDAVARWPGVAVGLGTGNVRRGAEIKLRRAALDRHFGFGGFGCDHEDRRELLRVGLRRGASRLGADPEHCPVVVIGDTPRDVWAAREIGAECVAVTTGSFGRAELEREGATAIFDTLADAGVLEAIGGDLLRHLSRHE